MLNSLFLVHKIGFILLYIFHMLNYGQQAILKTKMANLSTKPEFVFSGTLFWTDVEHHRIMRAPMPAAISSSSVLGAFTPTQPNAHQVVINNFGQVK